MFSVHVVYLYIRVISFIWFVPTSVVCLLKIMVPSVRTFLPVFGM
jgi:hypothetical protein